MDSFFIINQKIQSIKSANQNNLKELFNQILDLINLNFHNQHWWICIYSYYNLFLALESNSYHQDYKNYQIIISELEKIIQKLISNEELILEFILNNPFNKEIIEKLKEKIPFDEYIKIKEQYQSIILSIPNFNETHIELLHDKLSIKGFLKLVKLLIDQQEKLNYCQITQMVINKTLQKNLIKTSENISDIINFGIENKSSQTIKDFIKKILLNLALVLYAKNFSEWKRIFLISTLENIARYFSKVDNPEESQFIYLLAAMENWNIQNYGYSSKCIYRISQTNKHKDLLIKLAIDVAHIEPSFSQEINQWKQEIINHYPANQIKQKLLFILQEIIQNFIFNNQDLLTNLSTDLSIDIKKDLIEKIGYFYDDLIKIYQTEKL